MSRVCLAREEVGRTGAVSRGLRRFAMACGLSLAGFVSTRAQGHPADAIAAPLSPLELAAIRDATGRIVHALERREASWLGAAFGLQPGTMATGMLAVTRARDAGARPIVEQVSALEVLERGETVRFEVSVRMRWVSPIGRHQYARLLLVASCVREGPRCTVFNLETHDQP